MARIALACAVAIMIGGAGRARACEPIVTAGELAPTWRTAIAALADELARRDDVDRCVTVEVERDARGGARVVVTAPDGSVAIRHVAAPDALRAVVLALVLVVDPAPATAPDPTPTASVPTIAPASAWNHVVATAPPPAKRERHLLDAVELETTGVVARNGAYDGGWFGLSARARRGGAFVGLVSRFQLGGRAPWNAMAPAPSQSIEGGAELGYRLARARFDVAASCELDWIRVLGASNESALRLALTGRAPVSRSRRLALYVIARVGVDAISDDSIFHAPMRVAPAVGAGLAGEVRAWR